MVRRSGAILGAVAMALVMLAGVRPAGAHAGHAHKIMGTVTMIAPDHVMVKAKEKGATEEKVITILLNAQTKVVRGTKAATLKDIINGQRVVVDVGDGKSPLTAKEIRLAPAAASQPATH